jgi:hypothetical protein
LLFLIVIIATTALSARSFGLATQFPWLPKLPLPGSGASPAARSTPKKRRKPSKRRGSSDTVVSGPWQAPGSAPRPSPDAAAAQAELDALLDKISAGGLESLTSDEKRRLNELSKRLR